MECRNANLHSHAKSTWRKDTATSAALISGEPRMNLAELADLTRDLLAQALDQDNRPLRLAFAGQHGELFKGALIPQRVDITEAVCDGITAHISCLSSRVDLPLEELMGLPMALQLVTDQGALRRFCTIVTDVRQGQSDGSLTTLQLTGRDAFAVMEGRRSNRIFLDKSALEVVRIVLDGWLTRFPALAHAFEYTLLNIDESRYPQRAFTFQCHESDADFIRRLLRRNGIAWFFRPGKGSGNDTPTHELVLFDDARQLPENSAGPVRYHRRDGTEPRDTISLLVPAHRLVPGAVARSSYDHERAGVDLARECSAVDQGTRGNDLAAALQDARIELPHAGDSWKDHQRLTRLDMQRHESRSACLHGIGGLRTQAAGEWNRFDGHPQLDTCSTEEREHTTLHVQHWAENNLPKELNERAQALLAGSETSLRDWVAAPKDAPKAHAEHRYVNRFTAVRRDSPIVPAWNPETDLPRMPLMTAVVVGPEGESVWCDEQGRVKVRILGLDPLDHAHASGAGTNGNAGDSAWVRVDFMWAGEGFGIIFPLRAGMEVDLSFAAGDPDRPMITGSRYNARNVPPRFSKVGSLPGNKAQSGIVTRELKGSRYQQLRFDDTLNQLSTQLASEAGHSELNLGELHTPRRDGQAQPRGEGLEAHTRAALAARGEQGVFVSADALPSEGSPMLERSPLIGLAEVLQSIQQQLAQLATTHRAGTVDGAKIAQVIRQLEDWENGSNTAPQGAGGGAAMVAVSAPSGIALGSADNLLLGAQTNIDAVSAGNTQITAGHDVLLHAGEGFGVFAHAKGIKLVTANDSIDLQAHAGDIVLTAAKRIALRAGEEIVMEAPKIRQVTQGAQVDLGGGQITQQSSGAHVIKSSSFAQVGPGGGTPPGLTLPASTLKTDEQFVLFNRQNSEPVANRGYRATLDDGQVIEGRSDAQGRTQMTNADAFRQIELIILPPGQ
jgi:type VI secretion system secreted protein VgrG